MESLWERNDSKRMTCLIPPPAALPALLVEVGGEGVLSSAPRVGISLEAKTLQLPAFNLLVDRRQEDHRT